MKKLSLSFLAAILLANSHCVFAGPSGGHDDDAKAYALRLANSIYFAEQNQELVWPGFHPASTPYVIQFNDKLYEKFSAYAFHFKPGTFPWQQISLGPDGSPIFYLKESGNLFPLDDTHPNGEFAIVDGQNSFVDWEEFYYLSDDYKNWSDKLMTARAEYYLQHESAINHDYFNYTKINYDSFNNPEFLKLVYLENAALTQAQSSDKNQAEIALRDAVAIHQYRNQLADKSALTFENGNEIIKGIPTFISWSSQQLNDDDYRKMSQGIGCEPLTDSHGSAIRLASCAIDHLPVLESSVYGRALDKKLLNTDWKSIVEKQFKSISQIAIDYYHINNEEAKNIVAAAKQKPEYDYNKINIIIDEIMTPYLKKLEIAQKNYKDSVGIVFRTSGELGYALMYYGQLINLYSELYAFNHHDLVIDDLLMRYTKLDDHYELGFDHLPYLLVHSDNYEKMDKTSSYTEVKLDENTQLIIDGVTMPANDFVRDKRKQVSQTLSISNSHLHFSITGPATLDATDGTLKLVTHFNTTIKDKLKSFSMQSFKSISNRGQNSKFAPFMRSN